MDNMRGRARGRRPRTRARGRPKKNISESLIFGPPRLSMSERFPQTNVAVDIKEDSVLIQSEEDEEQTQPQPISEMHPEAQVIPKIDMEADISQLEAPTFTTINRGPPEAMLRLRWGHPVNLIGEKVLNPMIHCCDQCLHPVLIYGRMIPCKHVFCLSCAKAQTTECPRCKEKLLRVEETSLGTLFMCTHGGSRYGNNGCRRTYLSERDLQAHINHRHVAGSGQGNDHLNQQFPVHNPPQKVNDLRGKPEPRVQPVAAPPFYDNQKPKMFDEPESMNYGNTRGRESNNSLNRSSNLITVPLQGQPQDPYYLTSHYNTLPAYYQTAYQEYVTPPPTQTDITVPPPPPQQWSNNQQFFG